MGRYPSSLSSCSQAFPGGGSVTSVASCGGRASGICALRASGRAATARRASKVPAAVEEMLRWVTPIQNMMRTASEPVSVGGQDFEPGDRFLLLYPSANRDERVFEHPFEFDIARDPNPHVAFGGYGAHFCLGNALARLELRVLFEEWTRRIPLPEPVSEEPPSLRPANFVVGIETLPIRFAPTPIEGA